MRFANTLSFLVTALLVTGVRAQNADPNELNLRDPNEINMWGVGHTKCMAVLAFADAKDSLALDSLVTWTQGYLSAKIEEEIASGAKYFRLLSPSIVQDNMISFCSMNRGKVVSDAAQELSHRLAIR